MASPAPGTRRPTVGVGFSTLSSSSPSLGVGKELCKISDTTALTSHSLRKNARFSTKRIFLPPLESQWNQCTGHAAGSYRMPKWSLLSRSARNHLSKKANGKIAQFFAEGHTERSAYVVLLKLVNVT